MSDTLYKPFNLDAHNKEFINYCEVIIDKDGKIYYATPSHQMFMFALYGVETNQLPKEYIDPSRPDLRQYRLMSNVDIPLDGIYDIEDFIMKNLNVVSVYFDTYIGKPNEKQKRSIKGITY